MGERHEDFYIVRDFFLFPMFYAQTACDDVTRVAQLARSEIARKTRDIAIISRPKGVLAITRCFNRDASFVTYDPRGGGVCSKKTFRFYPTQSVTVSPTVWKTKFEND